MADNKVTVHHVKSCDLGKLGSDEVALKITFAVNIGNDKALGSDQIAVFGLSRDLARGLAEALVKIANETGTPAPPKSMQS